jgi:predicted nucleic acid-binding Zn ribbon protein
MGFAEEVPVLLQKPPSESAPAATDAGAAEARLRAKRGDTAYDQDPRGDGPMTAMKLYLEALDIDASCKPAYEGLARTVLAKAASDHTAVLAALRYLEVAVKRTHGDGALETYRRRLRDLLPHDGKRSAAGRQRATKAPASGGVKTCPFCGSPVPASARTCTSCHEELTILKRRMSKKTIFLALGAVAIVVLGTVAWVVLKTL